MLYRNRKKNDPNAGKWIGVGGKLEAGETPLDCVIREVYEETGLKGLAFAYRGLVHFRSDKWEDEDMYLFTARLEDCDDAVGEDALADVDCDEGELKWVPKEDILGLQLWEGDRCFLEKLLSADADVEPRTDADAEPFEMTLEYQGEKLVNCK